MKRLVMIAALLAAGSVMAGGPCANPNVKANISFMSPQGDSAKSDTSKVSVYKVDQSGQWIETGKIRNKDKLAQIAPTEYLVRVRKIHEMICASAEFNAQVNRLESKFKSKPYINLYTIIEEGREPSYTNISIGGILAQTGKLFNSMYGASYNESSSNALKEFESQTKYAVDRVEKDIEKVSNYKPNIDEQKNKELLDGYSKGKNKKAGDNG